MGKIDERGPDLLRERKAKVDRGLGGIL